MRELIANFVQVYPVCRRSKQMIKEYGWLTPKETESSCWDKMCIELIGPYTICRNEKGSHIKFFTMIDYSVGWFEIHKYDDKMIFQIYIPNLNRVSEVIL
jgi:hypothetical protein